MELGKTMTNDIQIRAMTKEDVTSLKVELYNKYIFHIEQSRNHNNFSELMDSHLYKSVAFNDALLMLRSILARTGEK